MLELFETPLTVLHILVCFFLILVVLIQPGKSGGLGAALGGAGAQQVFGGRGAGNFLSRATWICASTFFVTSMVLAYISSSADDSLEGRTGTTQANKATPSPDKDEVAPATATTASEEEANSPEPAATAAEEAPTSEAAEAVSAEPEASVVAPAVSFAVPSLGVKPALLSTASPVAPPKAPVAPVTPAPPTAPTTPAIAKAPAVVPAPANPIVPKPAVSVGLPTKSVPPALPLKPATPAASN